VIKAEFAALLLQASVSVTWSFRNHSKMMIWCSVIIGAQLKIMFGGFFIINVENIFCCL